MLELLRTTEENKNLHCEINKNLYIEMDWICIKKELHYIEANLWLLGSYQ